MKLLLLIDSMGSGGSQKQMCKLAIGLKCIGYEVDLFLYYPMDFFSPELKRNHVNIILHEKQGKLGLKVFLSLLKLVRRKNYAVVLSYLHTPNFYNVLLKCFSRRKMYHITSERSKTTFSGFRYQLQKLTHLLSDCLICNSFHEHDNWIYKVPALKNKCRVIYNTVDDSFFGVERKSFSDKDSLNILSIGTIGPAKNGICLVEALRILRMRNLNVSVTWMGRQDVNAKFYGEYLNRMIALIEKYSLKKFWTWEQPTTQLAARLNNYDCLVLASKIEGVPNVVCETMASGLPVIISNVLDHPRLVKENINGYLFNPNDPNELADKIALFYDLDPNIKIRMSRNAKDIAWQLFPLDKMIKEYEEVINNSLA